MLYNTAERPSSATFAELVESLCLETRLFLFLTVALIFPKEVRCSKLLRVFGGPDVVTTSRGPEGSLHMNRKPQPPTPEMQSFGYPLQAPSTISCGQPPSLILILNASRRPGHNRSQVHIMPN